jgi:hypothetical protein
MQVDFFRGVLHTGYGNEELEQVVYWAHTPFGVDASVKGSHEILERFDPDEAVDSELMTTLDLPGLDKEAVQFIVTTILTGGYLDRPGVKHKGDAVLYVVVNEAIQVLTEDEDAW